MPLPLNDITARHLAKVVESSDDAGTVIGASKIARDITECFRLQARAEEHANNTQRFGDIGAAVRRYRVTSVTRG